MSSAFGLGWPRCQQPTDAAMRHWEQPARRAPGCCAAGPGVARPWSRWKAAGSGGTHRPLLIPPPPRAGRPGSDVTKTSLSATEVEEPRSATKPPSRQRAEAASAQERGRFRQRPIPKQCSRQAWSCADAHPLCEPFVQDERGARHGACSCAVQPAQKRLTFASQARGLP